VGRDAAAEEQQQGQQAHTLAHYVPAVSGHR
jgi:hypothetical protein